MLKIAQDHVSVSVPSTTCTSAPVFKRKWYAQTLFLPYFLGRCSSVRALDQPHLQAASPRAAPRPLESEVWARGAPQGIHMSTQV